MRAGARLLPSGALRSLVEERNIRSMLFQLSGEAAAREFGHRDAPKAVEALQAHGFHLSFVGEPPASDGPAKKLVDMLTSTRASASPMSDIMSAEPFASSRQSLLIADTLTEKTAAPFKLCLSPDAPSLLIQLQQHEESLELLANIAKEVLGSDDCLDTSRRLFGPHRVALTQIFYQSRGSFALVNLKPIVPGHVLVVPKRCVRRFDMLDGDEVSDLWCTAQLVGKHLERHYGASSLTFAIQDGPSAGQTVSHVHIHVIPRKSNDFECNDEIYTEIENHERALHVDNESRTARTEADMAKEADSLRQLFE